MKLVFSGFVQALLAIVILTVAGCSDHGAGDRLGPPSALEGKYKGDPASSDVLELDSGDIKRLYLRSETPELDQLTGRDIVEIWLNSEGVSIHLGDDSQNRILDLMSHAPGLRHSGTLVLDEKPLCQVWLTYAGSECDANPQLSYQLQDADAIYRRLESALKD
ncbi:MAG: hypothetical protein ACYC6C_07925 [Coriobacteriia bacterium]